MRQVNSDFQGPVQGDGTAEGGFSAVMLSTLL
jgi:hypothetical protein